MPEPVGDGVQQLLLLRQERSLLQIEDLDAADALALHPHLGALQPGGGLERPAVYSLPSWLARARQIWGYCQAGGITCSSS